MDDRPRPIEDDEEPPRQNGKPLPPKAAKKLKRKIGHYEASLIRQQNKRLEEMLALANRLQQRYFLTSAMLLKRFAGEEPVLFSEDEYRAAFMALIEVEEVEDKVSVRLKYKADPGDAEAGPVNVVGSA